MSDAEENIQKILFKIVQMLVQRYDVEEIRTLCFTLGVDYDNLRGEGKASKVRELVSYLHRHNRISDLRDILEKHHLDIIDPSGPPHKPPPRKTVIPEPPPSNQDWLSAVKVAVEQFKVLHPNFDWQTYSIDIEEQKVVDDKMMLTLVLRRLATVGDPSSYLLAAAARPIKYRITTNRHGVIVEQHLWDDFWGRSEFW